MPWRGPSYPGEFPTLGGTVGSWIEANCAIPDGEFMGAPYKLTEEMWSFLGWFYRLDPVSGKFVYRRGLLVRPQKWGKGPFSAAMICAEAAAEVLFDGWDERGEPRTKKWATPWIQVTAVSEDQTDNVWRSLQPMIELGALAADIPDTGKTRINLPGGGIIEPVTASARSRLGQRITFAVQDEGHSWFKENGGHRLADNQKRNLAGMGGRCIETTNAWDPNENSVAQQTFESNLTDVYKDFPTTLAGSFLNARERRRSLKNAYGDSWWVDLDRIDAEVLELLERDPVQAERFFGNRIITGSDHAFDIELWRSLTDPKLIGPDRHRLITIGFDGSRFDDMTALIATEVETGFQWPLGIWAPRDGEIDATLVNDTLEAAFHDWDVWRVYADPPLWEDTINGWAGRYGEKRIVKWDTKRRTQMAYAIDNWRTAMVTRELSHNGDLTFTEHVANARRRVHLQLRDEKGAAMWTIQKDRPGSPYKIDAAVAACLSWEARGDAVAAGMLKPRRKSYAF